MTTQPISYDTEEFSQEELNFLDDVSDEQIDQFLHFMETSKEHNVVRWYFSHRENGTGPDLMPFDRARFNEVANYFTYLRSHHERR